MAQGMNSYRAVKTSFHQGILKDSTDIARPDRLRGNTPAMSLEDKIVIGKPFPVDAKQDKKLLRDSHATVFSPFALIDEQLLAVKVDVIPPEAAGLAYSERAVIDDREQRLVIQVTLADKPLNLFLGEHPGKLLGFTDFGHDKPSGFLEPHVLVVVL